MAPKRTDITEVLQRLGGRSDRATLLRYVSRGALDRGLALGDVVRVARGRYALPSLPKATVMAERLRGVVSHESAAEYLQLAAVREPLVVHITVPRGTRRRGIDGVRLHFADIPARDVRRGVTTPMRTVIDCAMAMPFHEALAIADSALGRGLITHDDLVTRAAARLGAGRRRIMRVGEHADGRAANPFESALRAAAIEAGVGRFEPQFEITNGLDFFRVDLADPRLRLVLEADSYAHHSGPAAFDRDCRRYDELVRARWTVLRFGYSDVMFSRFWCSRVIADVATRLSQAPTEPRFPSSAKPNRALR